MSRRILAAAIAALSCACVASTVTGLADAGADAGPEAGTDAGLDAGIDAGPDAGDAGDAIPTTDEVQYLDFVLNSPGLLTGTGVDAGAILELFTSDARALAAMIGSVGDGRTRQLGFMIVLPAWAVDTAFPGGLELSIAEAARASLATGVAFHFSIESHYEWGNRPDLWNFFDPAQPGYSPDNVANVEWAGWNGEGYPWRFVDWGVPEILAPHMCYLSTTIQSEVARLGNTIGTAAKAAIDLFADAGHPELFSGITVDSEPSLDNYTNIAALDPAMAALMEDAGAPQVRLGYCAFTAMGYSQSNPPPDAGAAAAIANTMFIESWASAVAGAGVPENRLYTHVPAEQDAVGLDFTNAPPAIAFISSTRPGWTTYPIGELQNGFQPIVDLLAAHGNPHWGGTEAAPFDGMGSVDVYGYLRNHYANGATVVVMNTGATGSLGGILENAVYGPEAIAAYQRFLEGR